ncbi:MAG: ABC transporter permease [Planctomycetes bacterium]|nr:ABC transporter permease [Planctomycetota bacterium]
MIGRWWTVVAMEWAKWRRQRLPWIGLLLTLLVAVGGTLGTMGADRAEVRRAYASGGWLSYVKPNGFEAWSSGAGNATKVAALLGLVLGAMSMSGEAASGTWRLVAIRPVRRGELYWGKAAALALFVLVTSVASHLAAAVTVEFKLRSPMGPVAVPFGPGIEVAGRPGGEIEQEFASAAEFREQAILALLAEIAPLLALAGFALACSACFDNPGISMAVSFAGYVLSGLIASTGLLPRVSPWLATTYLGSSFETLSNLARHISNETPLGPERLLWSIGVPLGTAILGGLAGWTVFRRRDLLT